MRPTVQYEEAMAHAADKTTFAPGGRVTVPFKPRASDRWVVGGVAPKALPAGRLSGKALARRREGPRVGSGRRAVARPSGRPTLPYLKRVDVDPDRPGRGRRSGRPEARGLRLPAVLGADRQLDPARLGEALDDRLLRGRGGRQRQPPEEEQRRLDDRRLERLDEREDDRRHQRRPRQWRPGRADRPELRLVVDRRRPPEGAARQLGEPGQPRPADRGGRARPRRRRRQPRLRADRLDLRRRVHGAGPHGPGRAQQGLDGLPADVRHDRLDRQLPDRGGDRVGRRRRGRDHGLRLQGSSSSPVGSVAPLGGPGYDIGDTIRAYVGRIPASKVILGVPYYGRAWSTSTSALGSRNISGTKYGASTTVVYTTAREYAVDHGKQWDPVEGVAWTVYRRENCTATYGCVKPWRQLYYDDAKALGLKYDAVNRYNLRGAGIWALGYDGTRTELYSVLKAKFITDTVPPVISAASLSSPVLSPNGDGRMDTATVRLARHRPPPLRVGRPAVLRRDRRRGDPAGERRRQERGLHLGRQERGRQAGPGRPVPDHRLDRRRLEQPGLDQQGRDRRPARGGSHARRVAGLGLARRRRPLGPHRRCRGRPTRRSTGTARLFDKNGTTGPSLDVRRGAPPGRGSGTAGTRPGRRSPTAATRSGSGASTGPATRPSAT